LSITGTWPKADRFRNFTELGVLRVEYTGSKPAVLSSIPTNPHCRQAG
jgi:hypothetical protein